MLSVVIVQEKMLRENLNTATRSEKMMTNTGTEHSVSSDTPSLTQEHVKLVTPSV